MEINILEWLENIANLFPEKAAFSDDIRSISFRQLKEMSQRIGSTLAKIVAPGHPIAVISDRAAYTPAIFLGIIYSGCFYAPMDGTQPQYRLQQILSTLKPEIVIADNHYLEAAEALMGHAKVLSYQMLLESAIDEECLAEIKTNANENDPLYVIFTSGSTGIPKGVITSHHSLMCYIESYCEVMQIDSNDVIGNQSPLDYIAAIRDIYLPLKVGASTYIIPKQDFTSPVRLFDALNEKKITAIGWSVSALTLPTAMGAFEHSTPQYLRKVCFSGSVMPCKYLRIWQENLPDAKFVNQYGPTEATASCTYYEVNEKVADTDILPIGKPYKNYKVFLLNEDNTETCRGELGEICVSGPILALGYYNSPEKTDKTFIQNPLNTSYQERIYKTGDIGRLRDDGLFEFHGRKDRQIKHLGHRIELEEIEFAAMSMEGVDACCALYYQDKELLYLFYMGNATVRECAVYLRSILPGFMVPRKIILLKDIPKLTNGKPDLQGLRRLIENR